MEKAGNVAVKNHFKCTTSDRSKCTAFQYSKPQKVFDRNSIFMLEIQRISHGGHPHDGPGKNRKTDIHSGYWRMPGLQDWGIASEKNPDINQKAWA